MPQDRKLRLMATRELLELGNVPMAKQMFATIAFNAHTGAKLREKNRQVMNEIIAGNATKALALLKGDEEDSDDD